MNLIRLDLDTVLSQPQVHHTTDPNRYAYAHTQICPTENTSIVSVIPWKMKLGREE